MTVARTAAHYGAVVRTSTQVVALLREGDRVVGVEVRDSEDGAVTEVRGHVVVNATGVWTDEIQALSKQRGRFRVRASKGVHIVVPARPHRQRGRDHPAHREVGAVRHPVGHALDHRHHRHRLEPRPGPSGGHQGRHRLHPRARQHRAGDAADPRRHRRRLRGAASAAGGGERGDVQAVARACGRRARARVWWRSPAASTRPTA